MKALFISRKGTITERDVPGPEWSGMHPVLVREIKKADNLLDDDGLPSKTHSLNESAFYPRVFRHPAEKTFVIVIYVEHGVPEDIVDKTGKTALALGMGVIG